MPLFDRLFPREVSAAEIEDVSRRLAVASAPPDGTRVRCLCTSARPAAVCDWIEWSLWQDERDRRVWVHCSGGVGGVDLWYGPGDPAVAAELGTA